MKLASKLRFFLGIAILVILALFYFIEIEVERGIDYVTFDTLLGIIIFHNVFVFAFYILIGVLLVITGIKKIRLK